MPPDRMIVWRHSNVCLSDGCVVSTVVRVAHKLMLTRAREVSGDQDRTRDDSQQLYGSDHVERYREVMVISLRSGLVKELTTA